MTGISPESIDWRVSNTWDQGSEKWGMLVAYIDARTAMEKLDELDASWSSRMEPITLSGQAGIRCTLTVNGVSREDVGVPSNTEPLKGAFSDALKRAAVHFGIGRELYEMPKIAVQCEVRNGKVRGPKALPVFRDGRWDIDRKVGWVKYDHAPREDQGDDKPAPRDARTLLTPDALRASIAVALKKRGRDFVYLERIADHVGASKPATQPQLAEMLKLVEEGFTPENETPGSSVPTASPATDTRDERPSSDGATTPARQPEAVASPPGDAPAADLTLDEIVAATGGELLPKVDPAIQERIDRANTRAKAGKAA